MVDGKFQSDKYPTCPAGKVPLSVEDPMAQDLLWEYARRRREVDSEFSDDLEQSLSLAGYLPRNRVKYRVSVQPTWCSTLPLQQQSVLFLAARGPDGVGKAHPCKPVQIAYRATVFLAARYGRLLEWGEKADTFMSLDVFADDGRWSGALTEFFKHYDSLQLHYVMHLAHGAEIVGYKHPDVRFRNRWLSFYLALVRELHLYPEGEEEMDRRLGDWDMREWR